MNEIQWDVRPEGRPGEGGEALSRYYMAPEKIEMIEGKLFLSEESRLTMLALLLENVGADQAVRIGNPAVWRVAVARLEFCGPAKTPTAAGTHRKLPGKRPSSRPGWHRPVLPPAGAASG